MPASYSISSSINHVISFSVQRQFFLVCCLLVCFFTHRCNSNSEHVSSSLQQEEWMLRNSSEQSSRAGLNSLLAERMPWDNLEPECQSHVQDYLKTVVLFLQCAVGNYSIPPRYCTECYMYYGKMRVAYNDLHYLDNYHTLIEDPCSQALFSNYVFSVVRELELSTENQLWMQAKCDACVQLDYDWDRKDVNVSFTEKTTEYMNLLSMWRNCITPHAAPNASVICEKCDKDFDNLYQFWVEETRGGTVFCLDVDSTMNDTMQAWKRIYKCNSDSKIDHGGAIMGILSATLIIFTVIFYAGSYIQVERKNRLLVQYSRLRPIQPERSRLMSSSRSEIDTTDDDTFVVPTTTRRLYGAVES